MIESLKRLWTPPQSKISSQIFIVASFAIHGFNFKQNTIKEALHHDL